MTRSFNALTEKCIRCADGLRSIREIFEGRGDRLVGRSDEINGTLDMLGQASHAAVKAMALEAVKNIREEAWAAMGIGKDRFGEPWPLDWSRLESFRSGFRKACLDYLGTRKKGCFDIYDEKTPFLQVPQIMDIIKEASMKAEKKKTGKKDDCAFARDCNLVLMNMSDNAPVFSVGQTPGELDDQDKFRLLVLQAHASWGGKEIRAPGSGKTNWVPSILMQANGARKGGVSKGGVMNFRFIGETVLETLWLQLLPLNVLKEIGIEGIGTPVWDDMPYPGEGEEKLERRKTSLLGRLTPMTCFSMLGKRPGAEDGDFSHIYRIRGIDHYTWDPGEKDNPRATFLNPAMAWHPDKKDGMDVRKPAIPDLNLPPWRQLPALLALSDARDKNGDVCVSLESRIRFFRDMMTAKRDMMAEKRHGDKLSARPDRIGIWCGGMLVSCDSGTQQSVKAGDCDVQSVFMFDLEGLDDEWRRNLMKAMKRLRGYAFELKKSLLRFLENKKEKPETPDREKAEKGEDGEEEILAQKDFPASSWRRAEKCESAYWAEVGRFGSLFLDGGNSKEKFEALCGRARRIASDIYDGECGLFSPLLLKKWAECLPSFARRNSMENRKSFLVEKVAEEIKKKNGALIGGMRSYFGPGHGVNRRLISDLYRNGHKGHKAGSDRWFEPRAFVAAMMCEFKYEEDGSDRLGTALAKACRDASDKGECRFRILALCDDFGALRDRLPSALRLIHSRGGSICFSSVLDDLIWFASESLESIDIVRKRWARDFYCGEDAGDGGKEMKNDDGE